MDDNLVPNGLSREPVRRLSGLLETEPSVATRLRKLLILPKSGVDLLQLDMTGKTASKGKRQRTTAGHYDARAARALR